MSKGYTLEEFCFYQWFLSRQLSLLSKAVYSESSEFKFTCDFSPSVVKQCMEPEFKVSYDEETGVFTVNLT